MDYTQVLEALGRDDFFGVLRAPRRRRLLFTLATWTRRSAICSWCRRTGAGERVYLFRMTQYANVLRREEDMDPMAKNLLAMDDPFYAEDFVSDQLLRLSERCSVLGGWRPGQLGVQAPRKLPAHLSKVYRSATETARPFSGRKRAWRSCSPRNWGQVWFVGHLLAGERALTWCPVSIPGEYFAHHLGVFGRTGTARATT